MDNQDKTTFSLDDEEIVEEEVIDRDEEYDDDEDYDDEGDEEYDDEEYDDEEYDDDYDDGYNDDYYDDRLSKVLDELAELKRGMAPAAPAAIQPQQPIMPPQYIYQPTAPPAGSEVVMYNEISRLRDELARNQSSLEMQKELTRIKEDMQRDQRFADAQHQAEIQRLQSRIDDLLKNGSSPQDELPAGQPVGHIEGGSHSLDLDKLLSINESILRAMRESDQRVQSELAQLKKQLEEMPSVKELNGAVSSVKKAANNIDGAGAGNLAKLAEDIAELKALLSAGGGMPSVSGAPSAKPASAVSGGDIDASELLRQLYEIKTAIGNTSAAAVKRAQTLSELVGEYKKVSYDVHSQSISLKNKLNSVYAYVKRLADCTEPDAVDLVKATNSLIDELGAHVLTRKSFGELAEYCSEHGITSVTSAIRDAAERFFNLGNKLSEVKIESYGDYLPDLIAELDIIQNHKRDAENSALVSDITAELLSENCDEAEVKDLTAQLLELTVNSVLDLPQIEMPAAYKPTRSDNDENVFTKLAELKAAVLDRPAPVAAQHVEPAPVAAQHVETAPVAATANAGANNDEALGQVLQSLNELKSKLAAATSSDSMSDAVDQLHTEYVDIADRLVEISEKLQSADDGEKADVADDERQVMLDDLGYIRSKLDEYETFFEGISDLRNDIAALGSDNGDADQTATLLSDQTSALISEITAQFDKLYEDLSGVIIESETNIINHIAESVATPEVIDAAKAELQNDILGVRDSLMSITDTLLSTTTSDAIEQLRTDLYAFVDTSSANADAAATDRQKLLDDIAFLREQAELAIAEGEQIPDGEEAVQDTEKFVSYLDEIAARVVLITSISDDTTALKESVGAVGESVNSVSDNVAVIADTMTAATDTINTIGSNVATVTETLSAVTDSVAAVSDSIAAINDNFVAVNDNFTVINDNVTAVSDGMSAVTENASAAAENAASAREAAVSALDALTPISDRLAEIIDRLDARAQADEGDAEDASANDLADIKASLDTVLDNLALVPQAEDVVTARDNTFTILDNLASAAQAEDVAVIRDNVALLLDAVNALSENNGQPDATAEQLTALRESVELNGEDIKAIRARLEQSNEEDPESVQNIIGDLEAVLDKLEQYELNAAADKQEIIDAVGSIKEEMHIATLDENMSAAGLDGETRDALLGEIAEIRERLSNIESVTQTTSDASNASLENLSAQIADLQAIVESVAYAAPQQGEDGTGNGEYENTDVAPAQDNDALIALSEELAAIREKLDAAPEYDTVEEILSLREDIKAARIVDQNDVSGELEAIKNELAAISSGNILDEIRALREDVANLPAGDGSSVPTDGEINLVLNEIVSLRDEVFAFKDEVLERTSAAEVVDEQPVQSESSEDVTMLLDELTALRADQSALTDSIDELKDIVSRRTTLTASDDDENVDAAPTDGELGVVLDEIINLKNDIERIEQNVGGERLSAISEQVEDIRAALDEIRLAAPAETEESGEVAPSDFAERFDLLENEIAEIRLSIDGLAPVDTAAQLEEMRAEIAELRAENEQLKAGGMDALSAQISDLKDLIRDMAVAAPVTTADGDTSYAALIDEIRDLKAQLAQAPVAPAPVASLDEDTLQALRDTLAEQDGRSLAGELGEIRDEIAQLRSLTTVTAESGGSAELQSIRDELAEFKSLIASPDSLLGVAEDVTSIKADVQTLKDEPDLGVMSEILALRDEFQALREQIEDVKRIAGETDSRADESLMNEVQSLRDQLFAISMANVNDPESGESNYESYNNIILDEIASIRDQMAVASTTGDLEAITEEFNKLQAAIDSREAAYEELAERVAQLDNDATNRQILDELASIRADMANQHDADLTTLNFMSEMAHLLERQNQYLTENAGPQITDQLESLKAEIASSDAVAEEVAKLREVMSQSGSATDNETILAELADLREELSKEKPSRENELILDAIARLRDEITVLAEREQARDIDSDADLSDSLSDLKEQLSEIAGIIEPTEQAAERPAPTEKKPSGAKRGRKPGQKSGQKSGTGAKRGSGNKSGSKSKAERVQTPVITPVQPAAPQPAAANDDFEAVIAEQASMLGGNGDMALDLNNTADTLDVADRLAKQVANKLIMEQLVEQLGDGGVSEERVDEILRDILPQEFTTIAETEASDKVRRLANQLVLNKLRARLNGNKSDD